MDSVHGLLLHELEVKTKTLWWQECGLSYTATGYGSKIPTTKMVRLPGEKIWRRLYCMIWSNSGTCYFIKKGERVIVS